ncbi:transcriptional regulator, MarR family [Stackebrandtia albiflava]|uniref:Transcriptional regulator, MarR family n=1 Tax=Stackebrandtia albiflava TaxID=406432 RepID=A0A562UPQ2_9ACTN|nr:MarR family transcriptional regulator [Stackebrandtia albiflava]TWJ07590.1 transcriptional regulator, MarR family [Stackebrandtia albiflava]
MAEHGAEARPPRLVFLTILAERRLHRWIDARGRDHGVTSAGAGVLFHLGGNPGATVGDITRALHASPAGASGLLARMETAGLITRTPDADDRRSLRVALTPAGREALASARSALGELNAHLVDGFTDEELAVVARWLGHAARLPDR